MRNISLTGELGSGKSTVSKYLISRMPYRIVSAGSLFRQLAVEHGMTAEEFNKAIEGNPKYDHYVDDTMADLGKKEENIIFDSRLAWHFVPDSFKIYMFVDVDTAAQRILNDKTRVGEKFSDVEETKKSITERRKSEIKRYKDFYGVDLADLKNFDLIVDTSYVSIDEVNTLIYNVLQDVFLGKTVKKMWISPKNLLSHIFDVDFDEKEVKKAFDEGKKIFGL